MCQDNQHLRFNVLPGGITVCDTCGEEVQLPEGVEFKIDPQEEIRLLNQMYYGTAIPPYKSLWPFRPRLTDY